MKTILTFILLAAAVVGLHAQTIPTRVIGSASFTNVMVASKQPAKLLQVSGYNSATNTVYVQVFAKTYTPTNTMVPVFSFPVLTANFYSMDFTPYGADLDGIGVAASTTANTLTLATNQVSFQVIMKGN